MGSVGLNLSSTSAIHWIGSERRDTTIAGFVYKDGILLSSDTQQEGGAIKIHASKIGLFECLAGKFAFAFAGNVRFVISAIQQCRQALHEVEAEQQSRRSVMYWSENISESSINIPTTKRTTERLHTNYVISFWDKSTNRTSLFMTQDHDGFPCQVVWPRFLKWVETLQRLIGFSRHPHGAVTLNRRHSKSLIRKLVPERRLRSFLSIPCGTPV